MWFSKISRKGSVGDDLGRFFATGQIVGLLAPLIASIIVFFYGFKSLFVFAGTIYLISTIPLFYLSEFQFKEKVRMNRFFQLLKEYPWYFLAEIFENIREDAEEIIWPVFIYLSFHSILSIGYIGTLSGVGGALFVLFIGKYSDRTDKRKLLSIGAIIMFVIWIFRFFVNTPLSIYIFTLLAAFFTTLLKIPLNTVVYDIAKEEGAPTFILFREFAVTIGRTLLYLFAFLILSSVHYIFIFTAFACLCLFYLSHKNLEAKVGV
jgi:MFS family permease